VQVTLIDVTIFQFWSRAQKSVAARRYGVKTLRRDGAASAQLGIEEYFG
jgi:hypothetical protein